MQTAIVMFSRKPRPRPALQSSRRPRRNLLTRLREQIAFLRLLDVDHATIAKTLRISVEDVRALSPKINQSATTRQLTRHAIRALVKGRHAHVGGQATSTRAKNIVIIASAYSWRELVDEPGIGPATATAIQLWLEEHGSHLRDDSKQ